MDMKLATIAVATTEVRECLKGYMRNSNNSTKRAIALQTQDAEWAAHAAFLLKERKLRFLNVLADEALQAIVSGDVSVRDLATAMDNAQN